MNSSERIQIHKIGFYGEQKGQSEDNLKAELSKSFRALSEITLAYLAIVKIEDEAAFSVALCIFPDPEDRRTIVNRSGKIFSNLFKTNEHLNIIFLTPTQKADVHKVCRPFFLHAHYE